ncbi:hypothetical protein [Ectopseudomonas mendocina]|uniref:hypothetical protein n=1 Tax=Ectopseudomonas mendocina TaxID=300 RepID=UPI003F0AA879
MSTMQVSAVGMLWFRNATQYAEYMAIFEDAQVMSPTYSQWLKRATNMYENLLRQGHVAVKVQATPNEWRTWCSANGHRLDAAGRMAFANFKTAEKFRQAQPAQDNQ